MMLTVFKCPFYIETSDGKFDTEIETWVAKPKELLYTN